MRWQHHVAAVATALGLAGLAACTVENVSHCGNRQADRTCALLYGDDAPHCSLCEAARNGCVAVVEHDCRPEASGATETTTVASDTAGDASSTSMGSTASDSGNDATTAASGSADTTSTTSLDSTGVTGTASDTTATSDPTTSGTSGGGPQCGNGIIEGSEECDGTALGGESCQSVMGPSFSHGALACNGDCTINAAACCVPDGGSCETVADCCQATACTGLNGAQCTL
jgi:hypothetical protein